MKLNSEGKQQVRQKIIEELWRVPEGIRVKFDKNLLEELIFDSRTTSSGTIRKQIVWHGDFLRKIDLSEVSFDGVCWVHDEEIDLSDTNVRIDFAKGYFFQTRENI